MKLLLQCRHNCRQLLNRAIIKQGLPVGKLMRCIPKKLLKHIFGFSRRCLFLVTNIERSCFLSTESSDDGSDDEMVAERDSDVSKVQ